MADPRIRRCMDRAASVLPYLPPAELDALVRAVLAEADQHVVEQEAQAWAEDLAEIVGMPADAPAWDWTPVEALVPGQAVWDIDGSAWIPVAANPPVHAGGEVLVTYEDGVIAPFNRGVAVPVAHDLAAALAWNRRHAPVHLVDDLDEEERGWEHLHADDRRGDDWYGPEAA